MMDVAGIVIQPPLTTHPLYKVLSARSYRTKTREILEFRTTQRFQIDVRHPPSSSTIAVGSNSLCKPLETAPTSCVDFKGVGHPFSTHEPDGTNFVDSTRARGCGSYSHMPFVDL